MKEINNKLCLLSNKMDSNQPIKIIIIGLGSVGLFLLDYLINLSDPRLEIIVAGRNEEKIIRDVNIIRTAATIRHSFRNTLFIEGNCDLDNIDSISQVLARHNPDFIVNCSRVYSGLKYGTVSWNHLRAYGIWTPLAIKYARNIMEAYSDTDSNAISINTSYSDAVIPWLKTSHKPFYDFGSGNLNHLIPRIKFYIAETFNIDNLNEIDITLATSHFHDVVISKEGHSEGFEPLIQVKYKRKNLSIEHEKLWKACKITMPVDQKRNMMNASSNFDIIYSIITALRNKTKLKIHSPGAYGELGGYPVIIDGKKKEAYFDTSIFSLSEMRNNNRKSLYLDGIENVENGILTYTDQLIDKVKSVFNVQIPKFVSFDNIDTTAKLLIEKIILGQKNKNIL